MKPVKKKRIKLTRALKKAIWEPVHTNAGAGWEAKGKDSFTHDPIEFERVNKDS
jgi:hypothetical protein